MYKLKVYDILFRCRRELRSRRDNSPTLLAWWRIGCCGNGFALPMLQLLSGFQWFDCSHTRHDWWLHNSKPIELNFRGSCSHFASVGYTNFNIKFHLLQFESDCACAKWRKNSLHKQQAPVTGQPLRECVCRICVWLSLCVCVFFSLNLIMLDACLKEDSVEI